MGSCFPPQHSERKKPLPLRGCIGQLPFTRCPSNTTLDQHHSRSQVQIRTPHLRLISLHHQVQFTGKSHDFAMATQNLLLAERSREVRFHTFPILSQSTKVRPVETFHSVNGAEQWDKQWLRRHANTDCQPKVTSDTTYVMISGGQASAMDDTSTTMVYIHQPGSLDSLEVVRMQQAKMFMTVLFPERLLREPFRRWWRSW